MPQHNVNINYTNVPNDCEVSLSVRKRRKTMLPSFRAVSLQGTYKNHEFQTKKSGDFLYTLSQCTSILSLRAFGLLHACYDFHTGVSYIILTDQRERNEFSKGFKELKSLGLVKRIKKQHYMLNPYMYINPTYFDNLCNVWDSLKP